MDTHTNIYIYMSQRSAFPVPPPSPPRVGSSTWAVNAILEFIISVSNPYHGSPTETCASAGNPDRGLLAEADNFFDGFLASERILGEHVTKQIGICRFARHVNNVTKLRTTVLFQLEVWSKHSHKPSPREGEE